MFRRILRVWPAFFLLILVAAALIALPSAHACKFWAVVSQSGVQIDSVLYNSSLDTFLTLAISPPAPYTNSPNGWAAVWYHPEVSGPESVNQYREAPPVSFETFAPTRAEMLADSFYAGVAHARRSTTGPSNVPDPHPFVYTGSSALFGKSYTFAHNGTVNNSAVIEDSLGTGFISLALFQDPARMYAAWNAGSSNRNDSEYYMMLLMKYLLVANNYYLALPAGIDSPAEWAINQTVNKIVSSSTYTSLNSVLTDGEALWLLFRKPAPLDNLHLVSYYSVPDNPNHRLAMTTLNPLGNGWTALTNNSHGSYGQYVYLKPNTETTVQAFRSSLMANPDEIRVNDAASLAQQHPAVSANPLDGSFVTVWETADGSRIKAKWYDQMGFAERNEFFVDESAGFTKTAPAVAHDPLTGDMLVVWLEIGSETLIKARRFVWDLDARTWIGAPERQVNDDATATVCAPKVSFDPLGNSVIVWSKVLGSESEIWSEITLAANSPLEDARVTPDNSYAYVAPDVCYAGRGRMAVTYAVSAPQQNNRGVFVSLIEASSQNISTPKAVETMSNSNDPMATMPSLDRLTDSTFVVGYWKQSASHLLAKRCFHAASMSSNLTIQQTYTLTGITAQPYVQVGARDDGRFYLCYQRLVSGSSEIYTVLAAAKKNFGTPELINTTTAGNQQYPAIAMALRYDANYLAHSYTDVFAQRRFVVWQSENQDGSDWGVVARMHGVVSGSKYPWYAADRYNESVDGLLAMPAPELTPINGVVARWASDGLHLTWPSLEAASTSQRSVFFTVYASPDYDGEYVEVDAVSESHWIDRQAAALDLPRRFYRVFAVTATPPPRIPQAE